MSFPRPFAAVAAVLALAGALALGAGLFGPGGHQRSAAQQPPGQPTPVLECFRIADGAIPNAVVRLTTKNFGPDVAVVRQAVRYCEFANKYLPPSPTEEVKPPERELGLQCYNIRKGDDPDDDVILDTQNFGPHKATIRTAVMMCENALKLRIGADGTVTTYGDPNSQLVLQCFKIEAKFPINKKATLVTKNFGADAVHVIRPVFFCEQAIKERPNHEPYGVNEEPVQIECFAIEAKDRQVPVTLRTRNFGPDEVRVRRGDLLCERAKKTHIFEDPAGGGDPTD
ncbi:MAG: hypothetical protein ACKVVT_07315 [Dehalococcoidia bacterium]